MAQLCPGVKGHSRKDRHLTSVSSLTLTCSHIWEYCKNKRNTSSVLYRARQHPCESVLITLPDVGPWPEISMPYRPHTRFLSFSVLAYTAVFLQKTSGWVDSLSKISCSYGLTGMKGDVSFMSLLMCLMLRLLLLEKHKVTLTSFLIMLRSSSRFTIRNFTGDIKKIIVKHSACNISLHKSASPFLCSSIRFSLFTSEVFRSFPKQPSPASPTPEDSVWEVYMQLQAVETHYLYLGRLQWCVKHRGQSDGSLFVL